MASESLDRLFWSVVDATGVNQERVNLKSSSSYLTKHSIKRHSCIRESCCEDSQSKHVKEGGFVPLDGSPESKEITYTALIVERCED